ncbi:uncharacterized protein K460DRAFT_14642 [Cucurbitaria berberidis CBS 394.84]|uniref:NACHT domain-containing protein n=1 Tax=Cucurbitaria berberidis CBS 394.84 TaxID=1168544 RepID=A0A9P4LDR3_9PLEO|nr:uncharacterized protein K460DRAFT_14642 [Cucurbitaria berberidis CBS 394.84]KAF1850369.1 hypothetical protein K460DRAFT_14642 [Cucurbitaria berberidis CBS 394.84]
MEALAAIGLVGCIVQFVEAGTKVIKTAKEIQESKSGLPGEIESLRVLARDMHNLSTRIAPATTKPHPKNDEPLLRLAQDCRHLSEQILALTDKMAPIRTNSRPIQAINVMIKSRKYSSERKVLEQKLADYRSMLQVEHARVSSLKIEAQLLTLADSAHIGNAELATLNSRTQELQKGVTVTYLGGEAQKQLQTLLGMTDRARDRVAERQILKSLAFDDMHTRFDVVNQAHVETFRWLLDDDTINKSPGVPEARDRFIGWLSSGKGIFHIAGKLGSGKSTLMKFICGHPRTKAELRVWAGQCKLVVVNFFFWRPGSRLQKSFEGLLRSLLHGVLVSSPKLIPLVFPGAWDRIRRSEIPTGDVEISDEAVSRGFNIFLEQRNICKSHRFCFFIDALDEFESTTQQDYVDMITEFRRWTSCLSGDIKLCVSSREHNVFQDRLLAESRIRLQDLTKNDMLQYTRSRLDGIPENEYRERLTTNLVSRSNGIFLWVALVVKALREALDDGRDLASLEEELATLPEDLEKLFKHLLKSIPERQLKKAYQIFAMVLELESNAAKLSLFAPLHLDAYEKDPQFALKEPFPLCSPSLDDIDVLKSWQNGRVINARRLMQGCCKGLVEMHRTHAHDPSDPKQPRFIRFLHRTIIEFFKRPLIREAMDATLVGFDVVEAISQVHLADFQSTHRLLIHKALWREILMDIINMRFRGGRDVSPYSYLTRLESTVREKLRSPEKRAYLAQKISVHMFSMTSPTRGMGMSLLDDSIVLVSASIGAVRYVHWKVQQEPVLIKDSLHSAILLHLLCHQLFYGLPSRDFETIQQCFELILEDGPPVQVRYQFLQSIMAYARTTPNDAVSPVPSDVMGRFIGSFLEKSTSYIKLHSMYLRVERSSSLNCVSPILGYILRIGVLGESCVEEIMKDQWKAPTIQMLAERIEESVGLEELVKFWNFENTADILQLIKKGREDERKVSVGAKDWTEEQQHPGSERDIKLLEDVPTTTGISDDNISRTEAAEILDEAHDQCETTALPAVRPISARTGGPPRTKELYETDSTPSRFQNVLHNYLLHGLIGKSVSEQSSSYT